NQGSSTIVTTFARKLAENIDYKGELGSFIEGCGFTLGVDVLEHRLMNANEKVADKLEIDSEEEILELEKLFLADGMPSALCINRIPKKYLGNCDFGIEDLSRSMFDFVEDRTGYIFSYDVMEIIPEIATDKLIQVLNLDENIPLLRVDVIKYSIEGVALMYNS